MALLRRLFRRCNIIVCRRLILRYGVAWLLFRADHVQHPERHAVTPAETVLQRILTAATAGTGRRDIVLLNQFLLAIVGMLNVFQETPVTSIATFC